MLKVQVYYCHMTVVYFDNTIEINVQELWLSVLHHVSGVHEWALAGKCQHQFIMEGSVEQRVLENRRSLAADRAGTALLDGSGDLEEEEKLNNVTQTRERHTDENGMGETSFQRLRQFGAGTGSPDSGAPGCGCLHNQAILKQGSGGMY